VRCHLLPPPVYLMCPFDKRDLPILNLFLFPPPTKTHPREAYQLKSIFVFFKHPSLNADLAIVYKNFSRSEVSSFLHYSFVSFLPPFPPGIILSVFPSVLKFLKGAAGEHPIPPPPPMTSPVPPIFIIVLFFIEFISLFVFSVMSSHPSYPFYFCLL